MNISRLEMMDALVSFTRENHGCVVGAPGAGKSYSLKQVATQIIEAGGVCLYLPVDKLPAKNHGDLKTLLQFEEKTLVEFLTSHPKREEGYSVLIVDALDAARSEATRVFYGSLISEVVHALGDTWRVVCSVRAFDAKRMNNLLNALPSSKKNNALSIFEDVIQDVHCRHFNIPALTERDILEAATTIPGLETLYSRGNDDLKCLLYSPFNLWIIHRLVEGGLNLSEVSDVRTESDLLNFYWNYRLAECADEEAAKALLRAACMAMVNSHSLSAVRSDLVESGHGAAIPEVLRAGLLEDMTRTGQRVVFPHNILFDFAVSVLLIDETPKGFRSFVTEETSRTLFLRPSIEFFLERIWTESCDLFWNIFWDLLAPDDEALRLVGRLLPPAVLLRNAVSLEELDPIFTEWAADPVKGELALQRVLQALHTLDVPSGREELWAGWCCRIAETPSLGLLFYLTRSLEVLLEAVLSRQIEDSSGQTIGEASRKLLRWILTERNHIQDTRLDRIGAIGLVPLVCKTVRTDTEDSVDVLSDVIILIEEKSFPIEYISRLCHNITPLMEHTPAFAAKVYRVIFGRDETSDDQTVMRDGVLSLTSNRRQDFRMCHYALKEAFPEFLKKRPEEAVVTAVIAGTAGILVAHRYRDRDEEDLSGIQHSFDLLEHKWTFLEDGCHIWGQSTHPDDAEEIGHALFAWIREELESGLTDRFTMFLITLKNHTCSTFFWRQVFVLAAEFPDLLVEAVWQFATVSVFLHLSDVRYEMGTFLAQANARLTSDQLGEVERTILDLPDLATGADDENPRYFPYARDCMLKKLGSEFLSESGRTYLEALGPDERAEIPPPHTFNVNLKGYSEKEALREQGIGEDTPGYNEMTLINEKMSTFCNQWQNKRPDAEGVQQGLPLLREAWNLYNSNLVEIELLKNRLITQCSRCCEKLSTGVESPRDEAYDLCKEILLYCAEHSLPEPYDEMDQQFTYPSWSPAPRTEAAQGLPWLARFNSGDDADLLHAIERLSADPVPSVRYLLAEHLFRLAWEHEDKFWRLIETRSTTEKNTTVLLGLAESLRHVIGKDTDKACELLDHLVPAALADTERENLMDRVIALAVGTYLHFDHEWGRNVIAQISDDPGRKPKAMNRAMLDSVGFITPTLLDDAGDIFRAEKARDWLLQVIPSVAQRVVRFLDEGNSEKGTELYHGLDTVVSQIYFPLADTRGGGRKPASTSEQKTKFFSFIRPLLECVLDSCEGEQSLGLHAHTAHQFVEMLNLTLSFDPPYVLHQARRVIELGQAGNYQHDSLAIGEVVKLVESVLANHRGDIREGDALNDLIEILDIFCDAGSTKALNLVWRLDEIFR